MKRPDAGALTRLASLRTSLAGTPEPDVRRLLELPAPTEPADASRAEERLVCAALAAGLTLPRAHLAAAVRTSLARLEEQHPGKLVEVRIPPFGAVQIGMVGVASAHTRGTPPNVVETDAATWLLLVSRHLSWHDARADHRVRASGAHADLGDLLA